MSRLVALLLLYKSGYLVGKYISIKDVFTRHIGKVSKQDILDECPDISMTTVERTLKDLVQASRIRKVGGGRSTAYVAVNQHDDKLGRDLQDKEACGRIFADREIKYANTRGSIPCLGRSYY